MSASPTLGTAYIQIQADVDRFSESVKAGLKKLAGLAVAVLAFKKLAAAASAARKTLLLTFAGLAGTAFAAAAVGKVLALAGALLQLTGVAAGLPAVMAIGGAAIGGLLIATKGLGEAFGAAFKDQEKFDKAIENLGPKAKDLAREFQSLVPELRNVAHAAQDAFAGQLTGQITATVRALEGPLASGLAKIATRYGEIARAALEFARSQQSVALLNAVFGQTDRILGGIVKAVQPLLAGFADAVMAVLPMFDKLGSVIGSAFETFGTFLSSAASDGRLQGWLQRAMTLFGDLFHLIVGVGDILFTVLGAGAEQGASLLRVMAEAVSTFSAWLHTAEGAAVLKNLFTALGQLAAGLAPVLTNVLSALAPVLAAIAPAVAAVVPVLVQLSQALGPALAAIAGPLGEALLAVVNAASTLTPYLVPLGEAIGMLLKAVMPLIDALVWLEEPFQPLIESLKEIIAALAPVLKSLAPILLTVFKTLEAVAAPVLDAVVKILEALGPPVAQLVEALGGALAPIFAALAPVVKAVLDAIMPLLPVIVALMKPVIDIVVALTPLITILAQILTIAIQVVAPILQLAGALLLLLTNAAIAPLLELIAKALTLILSPLNLLIGPLQKLSDWLGSLTFDKIGSGLGDALSGAWKAIKSAGGAVIQWFKDLPGEIWKGLQALPGLLWDLFKGAFELVLKAIGAGIGLVLYTLFVLPGQVKDMLWQFLTVDLPKWWSDTWASIKAGIAQFVTDAVAFVESIPGRLADAAVAIASFLGNLWSSIWSNAKSAFWNGIDAIIGLVKSIPGRLAALPGALWDLGKKLVTSIVDGVKSAGDFVGGLAGNIVGALKSFVNWVITKLNEGISWIDDKLPGSLPRIPFLAEGDVIRKPTVAVVGEAGAEAVIPLTRPQRARDLLETTGLADLIRGTGGVPALTVRVFLGTREITDIVRVEVDQALGTVAENVLAGARA